MSSEDDNGRSDEYWMGVRDALRMVDSFNKWSKRNPGRAKDLDDFIHDGLIAAAKRCESCLTDKMGISFVEDDEEVVLDEIQDFEDNDAEEVQITYEAPLEPEEEDEEDDDKPEPSFEEPIHRVEPEPFTPPSDISDETSITLDSVERRDDEEMEDLSIEGPPREFSTDFELVEPTPLVVDEASTDSDPIPEPEHESEVFVSEPPVEEEVVPSPEPEELPDKPAFTWSEYEEAVSPSSEPEPLDPEIDIVPSEEETITIEEPEEVTEEPPEPPRVWSPYDEPSVVEVDDDEEDEPEVEEPVAVDAGEDEPVISEPPAPPPPPESEEDEEERKRRARRLFFGA